MAYSIKINDARNAGLRAAMEPADPREVPLKFAGNEALQTAWLEAYDSMGTSMLNQRYGVMKVPEKAKQPAKVDEPISPKISKTVPKKSKDHKPTMSALVEANPYLQ